MSMVERLDGFTVDGLGNVIAGEPQNGDVIRIDGKIERRYYAPVPPPPVLPDHVAENRAIIRAKAARLAKKGDQLGALTLLTTLGD